MLKAILLLASYVLLASALSLDTDELNFATDALQAHNTFRTAHGVEPYVLNSELSEIAKTRAQVLANAEKPAAQVNTYKGDLVGESVAVVNKFFSGTEVTNLWHSSIDKYESELAKKEFEASRSFAQIVWNSTREVGFAFAKSDLTGKYFFVAEYWPSGNVEGKYIENVKFLMTSHDDFITTTEAPIEITEQTEVTTTIATTTVAPVVAPVVVIQSKPEVIDTTTESISTTTEFIPTTTEFISTTTAFEDFTTTAFVEKVAEPVVAKVVVPIVVADAVTVVPEIFTTSTTEATTTTTEATTTTTEIPITTVEITTTTTPLAVFDETTTLIEPVIVETTTIPEETTTVVEPVVGRLVVPVVIEKTVVTEAPIIDNEKTTVSTTTSSSKLLRGKLSMKDLLAHEEATNVVVPAVNTNSFSSDDIKVVPALDVEVTTTTAAPIVAPIIVVKVPVEETSTRIEETSTVGEPRVIETTTIAEPIIETTTFAEVTVKPVIVAHDEPILDTTTIVAEPIVETTTIIKTEPIVIKPVIVEPAVTEPIVVDTTTIPVVEPKVTEAIVDVTTIEPTVTPVIIKIEPTVEPVKAKFSLRDYLAALESSSTVAQ